MTTYPLSLAVTAWDQGMHCLIENVPYNCRYTKRPVSANLHHLRGESTYASQRLLIEWHTYPCRLAVGTLTHKRFKV